MKLPQHWLNWLIEAETLTAAELNGENIDAFAAQVTDWQRRIQSHLPIQLNLDSERKAAMQLQAYSDELVAKLTKLRTGLQAEQQQLVKQKQARSAYNKAR
jgi:hypothetical protein